MQAEEVEILLQELKSRDRHKRTLAAAKLGRLPVADERIIQALRIRAESDRDKFARGVAAKSVRPLTQPRSHTPDDSSKEQTPMQAGLPTQFTEAQLRAIQLNLRLENQFKGGAGWFYWIAGLSVINTLLSMSGKNWSFFIGLGATQVVDGLALVVSNELGSTTALIVRGVAFLISLGFAGLFVAGGVLARRRHTWAFVAGMVLYALDGLIFLVVQDFISFGFHLFALYGLYTGLKAKQQLDRQSPG